MEFGFEGAALLLAALVGATARPRVGLFLFGLCLGFPDLSIAIRPPLYLRLEDVLAGVLLARGILNRGRLVRTRAQKAMLSWYAVLIFTSAISALFVLVAGMSIDAYTLGRVAGTVVIFFGIVCNVRSSSELKALAAGMCLGALWLGYSNIPRIWTEGGPDAFARFHDMREAAGTASKTPQALGSYGVHGSFLALLVASLPDRRRGRQLLWIATALLLVAIPVFLLLRTELVAIAVTWTLVFLQWRNRYVLVFGLAIAAVVFSYSLVSGRQFEQATTIDLRTGEGLSGRPDRWATGLEIALERPILGWGFGRERVVFRERIGRSMSHNMVLSAWIELGLLGPIAILAIVMHAFRIGRSMLARSVTRAAGILTVSYVGCLLTESMASEVLYFYKSPTIVLATMYCLGNPTLRLAAWGTGSETSATDRRRGSQSGPTAALPVLAAPPRGERTVGQSAAASTETQPSRSSWG